MKKIYHILFAAFIGIIVITIYLGKYPLTPSFNKEYTPVELWKMDFQKKKERKKQGYAKYDKPDMFTKYIKDITTPIGQDKSGYRMNYRIEELNKAISRYKNLKLKKDVLNWVERGPANVGGRTRALIVDPDDATHNTWFVGAASGGIWKTTNAGLNWTNISDAFTNLSVNSMAMAKSNHNIIYAGTGESFPGGTYFYGNGIWKSTDKGNNWTQLGNTATDENFAYVNRIIIDPTNENIVLVATKTGIFKSSNGGTNWTSVYLCYPDVDNNRYLGVEDLTADPTNFNVIFAGEHNKGIIRSTNAGNNWSFSSIGIPIGTRFEIAVSPVDHNYVFASVNVSNEVSNVYMSQDNGLTWKKFNDAQPFLSTQGDYDNTIAAHPYIANQVFIGGVDIWKLAFNGTESSLNGVSDAYTQNTSFLSFIDFGGSFLGGGLSNVEGTNLLSSDWVSIEVRFGPGLSQKAHRFIVPAGSTSGVPASDYTYIDYVDVPFQVWDIKNDRQLMVSFRDQEQDGEFNLYKRTGNEYGKMGREYIFVHSVEYNATNPDSDIASNGHHLFKSMYMFWSVLAENASWQPNSLPASKIIVDYGANTLFKGVKTSIADSYGNFGGPNGYEQGDGLGTYSIPGLHPDHHNMVIIPTGNGNFSFIDANDGGIAISTDNAETFNMCINNYITTQFYGIAKNPQANEYFGGMQDNGSWQSPRNIEPSNTTNYLFRIGGDGFECLWHAEDPNLMLGSVYNNSIRKSRNRGSTWIASTTGIASDDGPFITRLSASKENPDLVFAVGNSGVYRSINFGSNWTKRNIFTNWAIENLVSSTHNVEVTLANGNIVWAGGGMAENKGLQIQLSRNGGLNFSAINDYTLVDMNANISGIATHPTEDSTAYILFSLKGKPKVLQTKNLGQSWEDISGFGTNNVSSNGFPDVVVNCLLVMPHDPKTIWVGTDIGLFESTDNGATWHIANNGLPPVSIFEMKVFGHQLVVATHGRGIWTVDLPKIDNSPYIKEFTHVTGLELNINTNLKVEYDSVQVFLNGVYNKTVINPATGINNITIITPLTGLNVTYIKGYIADIPYKSNTIDLTFSLTSSEEIGLNSENQMRIFPNPNNGNFKLYLKNHYKEIKVWISSLDGKILYKNSFYNQNELLINSGKQKSGIYIINVYTGEMNESRRLIIQ